MTINFILWEVNEINGWLSYEVNRYVNWLKIRDPLTGYEPVYHHKRRCISGLRPPSSFLIHFCLCTSMCIIDLSSFLVPQNSPLLFFRWNLNFYSLLLLFCESPSDWRLYLIKGSTLLPTTQTPSLYYINKFLLPLCLSYSPPVSNVLWLIIFEGIPYSYDEFPLTVGNFPNIRTLITFSYM